MSSMAMVAYTDYRSDPRVRREAEALTKAGHCGDRFLPRGGR